MMRIEVEKHRAESCAQAKQTNCMLATFGHVKTDVYFKVVLNVDRRPKHPFASLSWSDTARQ